MNGILLIDKPADFTSFDVIAKVRGISRFRKIGHGGTLDPQATGVLPLFFGQATRAVDILPDSRKRYHATFRLGCTSNTQDIWGELTPVEGPLPSPEEVIAAAESFRGHSMQLPPMVSAVQVGGVRLYDLARQGLEVEREARPIFLEDLSCRYDEISGEYRIAVTCSKGTYIRTICHDIGQKLGCGAVLTSIRRTMSAGFEQKSCHTLEELQKAAEEGRFESLLLPTELAFLSLPKITLNPFQTKLYSNGASLDLNRMPPIREAGEFFRVAGADGEFIGIGQRIPATRELKPFKTLWGR